MASEVLKERLSSLRRGQSPSAGVRRAGPPLRSDLGECFPEGAVCETSQGQIFTCEIPLREIHSDASRLTGSYLAAFESAAAAPEGKSLPRHLDLLRLARPATTALIDTETAGFHGRPLFLVGMVRWDGKDLLLSQCVARDYSEEAGVLAQLAELLPRIELLISFNGKAFDWPFVRDRMIYHRLPCQPSFAHLDLLHPSRRRWRSELPNCKLQTLERYLSGRWRSGDLPSADIPQRYHDFVREQDARLIAPVFHHNRLDLITMIELLVALAGGDRR